LDYGSITLAGHADGARRAVSGPERSPTGSFQASDGGFTRVRGADLEVDDATGLFTGRVSRHCSASASASET